MDLKDLKQQDSCEHSLLTPSGEKTDIVFILAGPTHPVRESLERRFTAKQIRSFNKKGKASLPEDPDEIDSVGLDRVVACTLGWRGLRWEDKDFEFSPDNARKLFSDKNYGWIRQQIVNALMEVENFMRKQSTS